MEKSGMKDAVAAAGKKKKAAVKAAVKKTEDKSVAVKIEAKKNTRKAAAAVKETAEKAGKAVKAKAGAPEIIIQSPMGGNITPAEIVKKLPKGGARKRDPLISGKIFACRQFRAGGAAFFIRTGIAGAFQL